MMPGYDFLKSQYLDDVDRRLTEWLRCRYVLRQSAPDTESMQRPWKPSDESLTGGTSRRLVPAEHNVRRPPGRSTTGTSGPKYRGAQFREELCTSIRRPCTRSPAGRAASEDSQERRWYGLRISCGRWAVPPRSVLTQDDVPDRPGGRLVPYYFWLQLKFHKHKHK